MSNAPAAPASAAEHEATAAAAWRGVLTLAPGAVLYRGPGGDAERHAHHAVQVMVALDEPFTLVTDRETLRSSVAVIPSGVPHRLECRSARLLLLLLLVEPFGARGRALGHAAGDRLGRGLADRLEAADKIEDAPARELVAHLLGEASGRPVTPDPLSAPVREALRHVERSAGGTVELDAAARQAHLSPSRLTHRFTREVGIPFRRYVLWVRLRRAVEEVTAGANLTAAAAAAGFSDSAHLSRVFRRNFGLSPSALLMMRLDGSLWPGADD